MSAKQLRTIEEHNAWRRPFHSGRQNGVGVECPLCHAEMIDLRPGQVTASCPPKLAVKCEACGHHDWIVA